MYLFSGGVLRLPVHVQTTKTNGLGNGLWPTLKATHPRQQARAVLASHVIPYTCSHVGVDMKMVDERVGSIKERRVRCEKREREREGENMSEDSADSDSDSIFQLYVELSESLTTAGLVFYTLHTLIFIRDFLYTFYFRLYQSIL